MLARLRRHTPHVLIKALSACGLIRRAPEPAGNDVIERLYAKPPHPFKGPVSVYFIGHSLMGRDMPAMLAQLAGEDHTYDIQLGWGATLQSHWEPDIPVNGFAEENAHANYRDAHEAVESGDYRAIVLTEMVEIRDAIEYYDSWDYVARWAKAAWAADPDTRVYLYETWPELDTEEGWLLRLMRDLERYWELEILDRSLNVDGVDRPIYVIPGGQVMERMVAELSASGGVSGLATYKDLFSDNIHFNDLGAYLIALTHYAVLYQKDPTGLPQELLKADGSTADAPTAEAARLMQRVVWDVVTGYRRSGVRRDT